MSYFHNRVLSLISVPLLLFCSVTMNKAPMASKELTASAVESSGTCGPNLIWTLGSEGTLNISGTGDMDNWSNSPWQSYDIKKVVIQDGVTSIGSVAFYKCTSLESITIPKSVTLIGASAFNDCTSLASIILPDTVTSIGRSAFENCINLTSVVIPKSLNSIEYGLFMGCTNLKNITIPESITNIAGTAFLNTAWLQTKRNENPLVIVNDTVIEGRCCSGSVTIPDGVTSINGWSFWDCPDLLIITIPESVRSIGPLAFNSCEKLERVFIKSVDCEIDDSKSTFSHSNEYGRWPFNGTFYGYSGSTTEQYAKKYGRTFVSLGEASPIDEDDDFNADRKLTIADAVLLARFIAEDETLTSEQIGIILQAETDQDHDGLVTIMDVFTLLKKIKIE